jgi:uncharacterized repeat protein (TIGR01451 family)
VATYTLTLTNSGGTAATAVAVSDALPTGLTLISESQVSGSDVFTDASTGNTASFTAPSVAPGSTDVFLVIATAASSLPGNTALSTTASFSSANGGSGSSNTVSTIVTAADLSLAKSGPTSVTAGGNATYTITLTNLGPSDASTVALTDPLPAGLTLTSATQVSGPDAFTNTSAGNTASFTIASLPAGTTDVFQVVTAAGAGLADGTTLNETATVTSITFDTNAGNDTATAATTVTNATGVTTIILDALPALTFSPAAQAFTLAAGVSSPGVRVSTGTVTFNVAGQTVSAPVSNGRAAAAVTLPAGLAAGHYPVSASFSGAGFSPASTSGTLTVGAAPTTITITRAHDRFGLLQEWETVKVRVTGPGGTPVNEGSVTLHDGGLTRTASVSGGQASVRFTFNLFQELKTAFPHGVTSSLSTGSGNLGSSSSTFRAPGDLFGFLLQIVVDYELFRLLTGSNDSGKTTGTASKSSTESHC